MPANRDRKYQRVVSYIEDVVGADVNRDLLKVALAEQDNVPLLVDNPSESEMRVKVFGIDPDGNLNQANVLELNDALNDTSTVQATYLARALASKDLDEFITRVTNSSGSQIDPLTMDVTASVANDSVRVVSPDPLDVSAATVPTDLQSAITVGAWNAGTLSVAEQNALEIGTWSAGTIPANITDRDGRVLGDVDVTNVNDSVQTEDSDFGFWNGAALDADSTVSISLSGQGSETVLGRVVSDNQYTVELSWKDDAGNEIFRDEVGSGIAGGTTQKINKDAISPHVDVIVSEGASAASTVNGTVHLT